MSQRRRFPRNTGGQGSVQGQLRHETAVRIQIHIGSGRQGRPLAAIKHPLAPVRGPMQEPKATAAETRAVGLYDRQGGADRHRRIEGVAPGRQDLETRIGGQGMGAGDRRLGRAIRRPRPPGNEQQQSAEAGNQAPPKGVRGGAHGTGFRRFLR